MRTDTTKLIIAFCNFSDAPKIPANAVLLCTVNRLYQDVRASTVSYGFLAQALR